MKPTFEDNINKAIDFNVQRTGLSSDLVTAIISQESGGDPSAVSEKGAKGLMQLMPLISNAYITTKNKDPFNVDSNVLGGTNFLKYLSDKYKKDERKMLAAYYAGETYVDKTPEDKWTPEILKYVNEVSSKKDSYLKKDDSEKKLKNSIWGNVTYRKAISKDIPKDKSKNSIWGNVTYRKDIPTPPPTPPRIISTPVSTQDKTVSTQDKTVSTQDKTVSTQDKKGFFNIRTLTDALDKLEWATPVDTKSTEAIRYNLYDKTLPPKEATIKDIEQLVTNKGISTIRDYLVARLGQDGNIKKGESREEYVRRFLTHMRAVEWNTSVYGVTELAWIYKSSKDDVRKLQAAQDLYDTIPDFYEKSTIGEAVDSVSESLKFAILDPLNLVSVGIGSFIKHKIAREGIKKGIAAKLKIGAIAAAPEAPLGAAEAIVNEQIRVELTKNQTWFYSKDKVQKKYPRRQGETQDAYAQRITKSVNNLYNHIVSTQKDASGNLIHAIDKSTVAINAALFAGLGGLGSLAIGKSGSSKKRAAQELEEDLRKIAKEKDLKPKDIEGESEAEAIARMPEFEGTKEEKLINEEFKKLLSEEDKLGEARKKLRVDEGGKILETLEPITDQEITQSIMKTNLIKKAHKFGQYMLLADPQFAITRQQVVQGPKIKRIGTAIQEVYERLKAGAIDDLIVQRALNRTGLTPKELSQIMAKTEFDSANVLNSLSQVKAVLAKFVKVDDPKLQKVMDSTLADIERNKEISNFVKPLDFIRMLERNSKALVVSGVGTTVRNVMGTGIGLTMDTAARTMEAALHTTTKVIGSTLNGRYLKDGNALTSDMSNFIRDSFGTVGQLTRFTRTAEEFDRILVDAPRYKELIETSLQEVGDKPIWKISRLANTLNVAQDAYFRKSVFTASVARQLRATGGGNLYEFLAADKVIPMDIIKNATEEALKQTFSFKPSGNIKGTSLENYGNILAKKFIDTFETIPTGSLIVPFPRFIANATAFQYRYSMFQFLPGTTKLFEAGYKKLKLSYKKGLSEAEQKRLALDSEALMREGYLRLSRGTVGLGLLNWAYHHRLNEDNRLTEWYNIRLRDGTTFDIRAIFPIAPFLAIGDFLARQKLESMGKTTMSRAGAIDNRLMLQYTESIMGLKLQPDQFRGFLGRVPELLTQAKGSEYDKLQASLGEITGEFLNRFGQTGKPLYSFLDMMEYESQIARDSKVTEGEDIFTETVKNKVLIGGAGTYLIPYLGDKLDLPEAPNYFGSLDVDKKNIYYNPDRPIVRSADFYSQILGVRAVARTNVFEQEFKRLDMPFNNLFTSMGIRELDRRVVKNTQLFLQMRDIENYIKNDEVYNRLSDDKKKIKLNKILKDVKESARNKTLGEFKAEGANINKAIVNGSISKEEYLKKIGLKLEHEQQEFKRLFEALPKIERAAINRMYKERYGNTAEADQDFRKAMTEIYPQLGTID